MASESEQEALEQIRRYLDAGHSIDDIDEAGWGPWLDHFEAKGIDVQTGKPSLSGPSSTPPVQPIASAPQVKASGNPFASGFFGCLGVGAAIVFIMFALAMFSVFAVGSCDTDSGAIILLLPH